MIHNYATAEAIVQLENVDACVHILEDDCDDNKDDDDASLHHHHNHYNHNANGCLLQALPSSGICTSNALMFVYLKCLFMFWLALLRHSV